MGFLKSFLYTPFTDRVEVYDKVLVKRSDLYLSENKYVLRSTSTPDRVLFLGGSLEKRKGVTDLYSSNVDTYTKTLTKTTIKSTQSAKGGASACSIGNLALHIGGHLPTNEYTSAVEVYDQTLTRSETSLSVARYVTISCSIGDYVIVAGGGIKGVDGNLMVEAFVNY